MGVANEHFTCLAPCSITAITRCVFADGVMLGVCVRKPYSPVVRCRISRYHAYLRAALPPTTAFSPVCAHIFLLPAYHLLSAARYARLLNYLPRERRAAAPRLLPHTTSFPPPPPPAALLPHHYRASTIIFVLKTALKRMAGVRRCRKSTFRVATFIVLQLKAGLGQTSEP